VLITRFIFLRTGHALNVELSSAQITRQPLDNFLVLDSPPENPDPPVESNSFLINGGFEDGNNGWTVCGGADGVESSGDAFSGDSALSMSAGACVYQSIPIEAGDEVTLQCQAKTDLNGYASMTLAIEDQGFQSLSSTEVPIDQLGYTLYQNEQATGSGAAAAVVTLYSDSAAVFDQCAISVNDSINPVDEPEPDPEPEVDPPSDDNLLANSGFESGLSDWVECGDPDVATISNDAWLGDSALQLAGTTCLYQQVPVAGGGTASFSGQSETEVVTTEYAVHNVSAVIPAQAAYIAATLYSEEAALADNCELVIQQ